MPKAAAEGGKDGAGNGPGRILDLLTQGGDPGVPGKGEKHQPGRRQHPAEVGGNTAGGSTAVGRVPPRERPDGCGPTMAAAATNTRVASTTPAGSWSGGPCG